MFSNIAVIDGPDSEPGSSSATAVVNSVVQFITPISVLRPQGPFTPPAPVQMTSPAAGKATIKGFKWHDLDQDGIWDASERVRAGWRIYLDQNSGNNVFDLSEPFAVTATDGSYVIANIPPGTHTIREDRLGLSDGMFQAQKFPAADPNGQGDPNYDAGDRCGLGKPAGNSGIAETPNFGTFEYSPLVRPADYFPELPVADRPSDPAATQPWQAFRVSNTTGRPWTDQ